jgi:hypothetical protein
VKNEQEDPLLPEGASLLRAVARAGRARAERTRLSRLYLQEGVFAEEADERASSAPARLAAASAEAPLMGLFVAAGWRVRFGRALDGATLVELEAGAGPIWLIVGEVRLRLNVGEAVLAPSLPPAGSPAIEDDRGRRHSLSPTL